MILDTTSKSVQISLAENTATNECDITASYADQTATAFTPGASDLTTNSTSRVVVVNAPAAATQRQVKEIWVFNNDTVPHTVILQLDDGGTFRTVERVPVAVNGSFLYSTQGGTAAALSIPVPITDGGTGATTAAAARTSLGAAALGANSDITSLTGLTTPLAVAEGGTGVATATANLVFAGPATGAGAAPAFRALVTADMPSGTTPVGANPTATAGPVAVNGTAATFMRSDAAAAVQKATSGQFGIVEVDGTTITAASGVISAVAGAAGISQLTGDVAAGPGVGSQAATLATVNSNIGSFTNTSITVNGKGIITAASSGTAPVTAVTASSPLQSSGSTTPAISFINENANIVLAGPASGGASAPTFRALVAADLPPGTTPVGANPTATAGAAAVNGSATTFMRSDAAPAVQIATPSKAGVIKPNLQYQRLSAIGVLRPYKPVIRRIVNNVLAGPWAAQTSPNAVSWFSVCWSPELGLFCAVANTGTAAQQIMTSPDGITWAARTSPNAVQWRSVCWSPELGLFCAVADNGTAAQQIMTSPDGITWAARTSPNAVSWLSVCWSPELGLFCAVTNTGTTAQQIMTSPDGITWAAQTSPNAVSWFSVCWSPELGLFCAVANTGTAAQQIMTSPDGITWAARTSPNAVQWRSVCWSPELGLFCAVADNGTAAQQIMTSPDGITWAAQTSPNVVQWLSVCWSPELGLFCAVANTGTAAKQIMTSPDGITWAAQTSPNAVSWFSVCWSPELGLFCAVADTGTAAQQIMTSPDGITPSVYQGSSSNLTAPGSASAYTMMGLAGAITPNASGNIAADICGTITNSSGAAGDGIKFQISYGTGAAPSNGSALTGTQAGVIQEYSVPALSTAVDIHVPFNIRVLLPSLSVGTPYWFDLAAEAVGTISVTSLSNTAVSVLETAHPYPLR